MVINHFQAVKNKQCSLRLPLYTSYTSPHTGNTQPGDVTFLDLTNLRGSPECTIKLTQRTLVAFSEFRQSKALKTFSCDSLIKYDIFSLDSLENCCPKKRNGLCVLALKSRGAFMVTSKEVNGGPLH